MDSVTITLIIAVIMSILFLSGKVSYGLVTMSCAVALTFTKVLTIQDAFAGFTNTIVLLIACMFVLSAALQKTNIPYWASRLLGKIKGKNETVFVGMVFLAFIVMVSVMPDMVCIALVVTFLSMVPKIEGGSVTATKLIMPLLILAAGWCLAVPVGLGATNDFMINGYVAEIVNDESKLFSFGTMFLMRLPSAIVAFIYVLVMWRKYPDTQAQLSMSEASEGASRSELPKWKEYLVYGLFILVVSGLIFSSFFGEYAYIIPLVAVCIITFTNILSTKEVVGNLTSNTIWMMVGILAVTKALTECGATELLGELFLPLISWTDNGFIISLLCCTFASIMTTFLSNTGVVAILTPLAATVAISAGIDPRCLVAATAVGGYMAFCFPSGSTTCAFAYDLGKYNPVKLLKYNLPLLALMIIVTAITANIVFPPFG